MRWLLLTLATILLVVLFQSNLTEALTSVTGWDANHPTSNSALLSMLIVGLVLGVSLTALSKTPLARRALLRFRLKTLNDVEEHFSAPVIGTTPDYLHFTANLGDGQSIIGQECHRIILRLLDEVPGPQRRVLVTGGAPTDGKSTLASFLGTTLSRLGHSVLLIDADVRKPRQQLIHGVETGPGLSDFLSGDPLKVHTIGNLHLLTAGHPSPDAPQLLSKLSLDHIVDETSIIYDWIILDSGPVLGLPDAIILSRAVSAVVFTASLTRIPIGMISDALRAVRTSTHAKVLLVLTRVPLGQFSSVGPFGWSRISYDYAYGPREVDEVRALGFERTRTKADVRRDRIFAAAMLIGLAAIVYLAYILLTTPMPYQIMTLSPVSGPEKAAGTIAVAVEVRANTPVSEQRSAASDSAERLVRSINRHPEGLVGGRFLNMRVQLDKWPDRRSRYTRLGLQIYPYLFTIRFDLDDVRRAHLMNMDSAAIRALGLQFQERESYRVHERLAAKN